MLEQADNYEMHKTAYSVLHHISLLEHAFNNNQWMNAATQILEIRTAMDELRKRLSILTKEDADKMKDEVYNILLSKGYIEKSE